MDESEQFERASVGHVRATHFNARRFAGELRMIGSAISPSSKNET